MVFIQLLSYLLHYLLTHFSFLALHLSLSPLFHSLSMLFFSPFICLSSFLVYLSYIFHVSISLSLSLFSLFFSLQVSLSLSLSLCSFFSLLVIWHRPPLIFVWNWLWLTHPRRRQFWRINPFRFKFNFNPIYHPLWGMSVFINWWRIRHTSREWKTKEEEMKRSETETKK